MSSSESYFDTMGAVGACLTILDIVAVVIVGVQPKRFQFSSAEPKENMSDWKNQLCQSEKSRETHLKEKNSTKNKAKIENMAIAAGHGYKRRVSLDSSR